MDKMSYFCYILCMDLRYYGDKDCSNLHKYIIAVIKFINFLNIFVYFLPIDVFVYFIFYLYTNWALKV